MTVIGYNNFVLIDYGFGFNNFTLMETQQLQKTFEMGFLSFKGRGGF